MWEFLRVSILYYLLAAVLTQSQQITEIPVKNSNSQMETSMLELINHNETNDKDIEYENKHSSQTNAFIKGKDPVLSDGIKASPTNGSQASNSTSGVTSTTESVFIVTPVDTLYEDNFKHIKSTANFDDIFSGQEDDDIFKDMNVDFVTFSPPFGKFHIEEPVSSGDKALATDPEDKVVDEDSAVVENEKPLVVFEEYKPEESVEEIQPPLISETKNETKETAATTKISTTTLEQTSETPGGSKLGMEEERTITTTTAPDNISIEVRVVTSTTPGPVFATETKETKKNGEVMETNTTSLGNRTETEERKKTAGMMEANTTSPGPGNVTEIEETKKNGEAMEANTTYLGNRTETEERKKTTEIMEANITFPGPRNVTEVEETKKTVETMEGNVTETEEAKKTVEITEGNVTQTEETEKTAKVIKELDEIESVVTEKQSNALEETVSNTNKKDKVEKESVIMDVLKDFKEEKNRDKEEVLLQPDLASQQTNLDPVAIPNPKEEDYGDGDEQLIYNEEEETKDKDKVGPSKTSSNEEFEALYGDYEYVTAADYSKPGRTSFVDRQNREKVKQEVNGNSDRVSVRNRQNFYADNEEVIEDTEIAPEEVFDETLEEATIDQEAVEETSETKLPSTPIENGTIDNPTKTEDTQTILTTTELQGTTEYNIQTGKASETSTSQGENAFTTESMASTNTVTNNQETQTRKLEETQYPTTAIELQEVTTGTTTPGFDGETKITTDTSASTNAVTSTDNLKTIVEETQSTTTGSQKTTFSFGQTGSLETTTSEQEISTAETSTNPNSITSIDSVTTANPVREITTQDYSITTVSMKNRLNSDGENDEEADAVIDDIVSINNDLLGLVAGNAFNNATKTPEIYEIRTEISVIETRVEKTVSKGGKSLKLQENEDPYQAEASTNVETRVNNLQTARAQNFLVKLLDSSLFSGSKMGQEIKKVDLEQNESSNTKTISTTTNDYLFSTIHENMGNLTTFSSNLDDVNISAEEEEEKSPLKEETSKLDKDFEEYNTGENIFPNYENEKILSDLNHQKPKLMQSVDWRVFPSSFTTLQSVTEDLQGEEMQTSAEMLHADDEAPIISGKLMARTVELYVKVMEQDSSFFLPQDSYIFSEENWLNITWKSMIPTQNNSLEINLSNSRTRINFLQLRLVKGDETTIHRKTLNYDTQFYKSLDDKKIIAFDEGITVEFSNLLFLECDNCERSDDIAKKPLLAKLFVQVGLGLIGVVIIVGSSLYYIYFYKKDRADLEIAKANSVAA